MVIVHSYVSLPEGKLMNPPIPGPDGWVFQMNPAEDVFVHEMSMAEAYNPDMEKSKEYRKWLKADAGADAGAQVHFMVKITR